MSKKNFLLIALSIIAAISLIGVIYIIYSNKCSYREPIKDTVVLYLDCRQLVEKGAVEKFISEPNRRFIATLLSSDIEGGEYSQQLSEIASNPDNTGITFSKPLYSYINGDFKDNIDMVVIAEVHDVERVDATMEMVQSLLDSEFGYMLNIRRDGDNRIIESIDIFGGYNDSRLAIVCSRNHRLRLTQEALSRPLADLSIFEGQDAAVYANMQTLLTIFENNATAEIEQYRLAIENSEYDYEAEMYEYKISSLNDILTQVQKLRPTMEEDASLIAGLRFDAGRVTLSLNGEGVNSNTEVLYPVDNSHLKYLDEELIAVANYGINGKVLAEYLNNNLSSQLSSITGLARNDFNMAFQIALDALSSIDGDVTIALNSLDGEEHSHYNSYWMEQVKRITLDDMNLLAIMDVSDSYIYDNIRSFAGGFLTREEEDSELYSMPLSEDMKLYLGEEENLFYAGINSIPTESPTPATAARWIDNVEGCGGYVVLDIESFMYSSYIHAWYINLTADMDEADAELCDRLIDISDYVYHSIIDIYSMEFVWVFDDVQTNSLEQIMDIVAPCFLDFETLL